MAKLVDVESVGSFFQSLSDPRHTRNRKHLLGDIIVIATAVLAPMAALAQSTGDPIPTNASANRFGSGWDCDQGYRKAGNGCEPIRAPANAVLSGTSYGRGWECRRGFREDREKCHAIEIPANAYLTASGVQWKCDRGFRQDDESCIAINVPEHGYLTESSYGPGWACERGYRADAAICPEPTHGRLTHANVGVVWFSVRVYGRPAHARLVLPHHVEIHDLGVLVFR